MKALILTCLAFTMLATAACNDGGGSKKKEEKQQQPVVVKDETPKGDGEEKPVAKDETPKDYFNQFLFRTSGKCNSRYGVTYHYVQSEDIPLEAAYDGSEMVGVMELYLKEDKTFQTHFEERKVIEREGNHYDYQPLNEETRFGTWRILPNGRLELTSLINGQQTAIAEGRAATYEKFPIIEMHFRTEDGQLIDHGIMFGNVGSTQSHIDICK